MLIRSKLYIALALSITLIGVAIFTLLFMYKDVERVANEQTVSNEIIKNVFELNILTNDYILYKNNRADEQWKTKYNGLYVLLEAFVTKDEEVSAIKKIIEQDFLNLKDNFDFLSTAYIQNESNNLEIKPLQQKLIDHINETKLDEHPAMEVEEILEVVEQYNFNTYTQSILEERLVGTISVDSQNIVSQAFHLHNLLNDKLKSLQLRIYYVGFLTILLLFVVILLLSVLFYHNVIHPIANLSMGAKEIAKGNYGYKLSVDNTSNDEIDQLSDAFNDMSESIRQDQIKLKEQSIVLNTKQKKLEDQKKAILNVLDDVEKEKDKSNILAQDLKKFKMAVDEASDQIFITDPKGVILYANKATEETTGYKQEELLGRQPMELWAKNFPQDMYNKIFENVTEKQKTFETEFVGVKKDGSNYYNQIYLAPILDDNKKTRFIVSIERDVTKEREVDRAKTEFVSLASHQLRTPLTAVNWYSEMLLDKHGEAKLNQNQKKYLNMIYHSNQRMTQLVNSLLNVSRIEMGTFAVELKKVDLLEVVDSVIDELDHSIEVKKIKFEKKFNKGIPKKMKLDSQLMRIIIQNILSNAVKYTPEGGQVSLVIKKTKKDIKITVADTGYGIPKEAQGQIFTKLYRADNIKVMDTTGTGLGLYLVKSILDHVGGKIWFESAENKGTTFHVSLPLKGMKSAQKGKKLESNIV